MQAMVPERKATYACVYVNAPLAALSVGQSETQAIVCSAAP